MLKEKNMLKEKDVLFLYQLTSIKKTKKKKKKKKDGDASPGSKLSHLIYSSEQSNSQSNMS